MQPVHTEQHGRQFHLATLAVSLAIVAVAVACGVTASFNWLELVTCAAAALFTWLSWRVLRISVFGVVAGLIGVGLLTFYTACLSRATCVMTLGFLTPLLFVGLVCMAISCALFLALGSQHQWRRRTASAIVAFPLIQAMFFLVAFPFASRERRLLHDEQMNARVPVLMAVVNCVETSRKLFGRIPADQSEFLTLIGKGHSERLNLLGCCWLMDYSRMDAGRYKLRYQALDVDYLYDSGTPDRGWYPNDAGPNRWDKK
jgi:hypothetical protein